ncbi:MAG: hypothetical protein ACOCV2_00960 [Persicimonas sp.]
MTSYQESDTPYRPDERGHKGGCLIPAIAAIVMAAISVTFLSWFWIESPSDEAPSDPDRPHFDVEAIEEGADDRLDAAILAVVEAGGWVQVDSPRDAEVEDREATTYSFRRDDARVRLTLTDRESARQIEEDAFVETDSTFRVVEIEGRAAIVETPSEEGDDALASRLAERLERFQDLLEEPS